VFINYRGEDSQLAAALIDRELTSRFGSDKVFLDCRSIRAGADFQKELLGRLRRCSVLLVVIGPYWLTLTDATGRRRIDDPQDWIRREIVTAFASNLWVIPVLIDQDRLPVEAELPEDIAGLARLQYLPLRRRHSRVDLDHLAQRITEVDESLTDPAATPNRYNLSTRATYFGGAVSGWVPVEDAVRDEGIVVADVLRDGFSGREWVIAEIDRFVGQRTCGYVWVEADAGVGKTALAAHLVRERKWVGHFARVTRGATVRVGLQNLAGQLVRRYELWDVAPGGMLPEPAFTPEGFERLLARAAGCARQTGDSLVLVLDGADESEPMAGAQPWGLPNMLPAGVFVVGTYRTGSPPPRCDAPRAVVRIASDDPRNRADVAVHLDSALRRPDLAVVLARTGVTADRLAETLAASCGGVWVYLRYILEELRHGARDPRELDELPADLSLYYIDTLNRWSHYPNWTNELLPILATLAVAGEPLRVTELARLSGIGEAAVRRCCHSTLRPFLTATPAKRVSRTFAIYHASLQEIITGVPPRPAASDQEWLWSETLRSATVQARSRIADHHLTAFGGLGSGLSRLAADPGLIRVDDGYPLRHLARHLVHAGRAADLRRLLDTGVRTSDGQAVNVWFAAHDHADAINDYLADVAMVRRDIEGRTDTALAAGQPAPTLADELRYSLVTSSIISRTNNIPLELLVGLLSAGMWTAARTVAHARRLPQSHARALVLAALTPHVPADQLPAVLDHALTAATESTFQHVRAQALTQLAPYLSGNGLPRALSAASAIANNGARALALTAIANAPRLPADQREAVRSQALSAASAITNEQDRARAVAALKHHRRETSTGTTPCPPAENASESIVDMFASAMRIESERERADALIALAPHLTPDQLADARTAAHTIDDNEIRSLLLTAIAARLPAHDRPAVLADALLAALTISRARTSAATLAFGPGAVLDEFLADGVDEHTRAGALAGLPPVDHLTQALIAATVGTHQEPEVGRRPAAGRTLAEVVAIPREHARARALASIAASLPEEQIDEALAAAIALIDDARGRALAGVIPCLRSGEQLARALAAVPGRDRGLLRAVLIRAGDVVLDGHLYVSLVRLGMRSVSRDTCLALLAVCIPRLRVLAGPGFDNRAWSALQDVHSWWT
jgi:hypothetical protein